MHFKRYRARTLPEALAAAREELGAAALVLSTRLVPRAGLSGWMGMREVEVTAAVDRHVSVARPGGRPVAASTPREGLVAKLCAVGFDRLWAEEIAAAVPADKASSTAQLGETIAAHLDRMVERSGEHARVQLFVGPPGAGKTTTIAKIAAQARVREGGRLGLVAADGFRVGAVEQLRLYADIIGSPFAVARTGADLDRAILHSELPVLVDTAGRSVQDPRIEEMFLPLAARSDVRTHLVLAAGTGRRELDRILDRYAHVKPDRVVLTKLDEAESVAPVVSALRERRLSVSYLGTGQRVPDDLERATAPALASWIVGRRHEHGTGLVSR